MKLGLIVLRTADAVLRALAKPGLAIAALIVCAAGTAHARPDLAFGIDLEGGPGAVVTSDGGAQDTGPYTGGLHASLALGPRIIHGRFTAGVRATTTRDPDLDGAEDSAVLIPLTFGFDVEPRIHRRPRRDIRLQLGLSLGPLIQAGCAACDGRATFGGEVRFGVIAYGGARKSLGVGLGVVVAGYGFGGEDERNVQPPPVLVRLWLVTRAGTAPARARAAGASGPR